MGFYGLDFGELNQTEWIYKEPRLSKLGDIQNRLLNLFKKKFNSENVEIYKNSAKMDVQSLDPNKNFIQLTSVKPYWEKEEEEERVTYSEKNTRIEKFIYEAPFTKEGKTQADHVKDQWKRVTILKTAEQFPFIKTRLQVTHTEVVELTPLETSIGDIEKRVQQIEEELAKKPLNPKTLQPVLQGVVKIMINKGPKEIVDTFLINEEDVKFPQHQILRLSNAFADLLKKCELGLKEDKKLVAGTELEPFHDKLEEGLEETKQAIEPFLLTSKGRKVKSKRIVRSVNSSPVSSTSSNSASPSPSSNLPLFTSTPLSLPPSSVPSSPSLPNFALETQTANNTTNEEEK